MKHLVVLSRYKPKISNAIVKEYPEQLEAYLNYCYRDKKRKIWATKEGFQHLYDSFFSDLQKAYYIYPGNDEVEAEIRKKFKVIEDNDYKF